MEVQARELGLRLLRLLGDCTSPDAKTGLQDSGCWGLEVRRELRGFQEGFGRKKA